MTLLDRTIAAADQRLVLLAAPGADIPSSLDTVVRAPRVHTGLLRSVQRLRGQVYLEDGAVTTEQLSPKGLHQTPEDDRSWHILSLDAKGDVTGCLWYRPYDASVSFEDLRVRRSPVAPSWREHVWRAVETDLLTARMEGLSYAELGGWAIAKANRCTSEILLLACAAYGLSQLLGDAVGNTTATFRNSSANILQRLGGTPFKVPGGRGDVPPYFDPHYGCDMQLLRFDSRAPHPALASAVNLLKQKLALVPVVMNATSAVALPLQTEERRQAPQYAA